MTANLKTITVREAMVLTGFSRKEVYRIVHSGEVQFLKRPGQVTRIRIFQDSLIAWMLTHAQGRKANAPAALDADAGLPFVESPFL